jgi:hypothetical protein
MLALLRYPLPPSEANLIDGAKLCWCVGGEFGIATRAI